MFTMHEVEVYVLIDANGDHAVGVDADAARERYEENIGALNEVDGFRMVKLAVTVPLPEVVEVAVDVPESDEEPVVSIKSA